MDFAHDDRTHEWCKRLGDFMESHIYPAEAVYNRQAAEAAAAGDPWHRPAVLDGLKTEARQRGLWNLFLAGHPKAPGSPTCSTPRWRRSPAAAPTLAPEALNCAAPDTGNMEVLAEFGTAGAEAAVAAAAAGRRDQVGVLHDRAGRGLLRREQHRHADRAVAATTT